MASGEQELSHSEIWDDSALINSWDEALEEYKVCVTRTCSRHQFKLTKSQKYHSIHRNGGNVNDLLKPKQEG